MSAEVEIKDMFSAQRRKMAEKYHRQKRRDNWLGRIINILSLLLFFYFALEIKLFEYLQNILPGRETVILSYIIILFLIYLILSTITGYFLSYRREKKFKLSNQSVKEWLLDIGKGAAINLIFIYPGGRLLLYLLNNFSTWWWLYFSIIISAVLVLLSFILPKILLPLFFTLEKYPEGELRNRLMSFIEELEIDVEEIYQINLSSKINYANAAVTGLGRTRRILLGDNLAEKYSPAEIEAVLAHELAHHIHGDIIKNLILEPVFIIISVFLLFQMWPLAENIIGYQEQAVYILPLLTILWGLIYSIFTPLRLYITRLHERKADHFAIQKTDNPHHFASMMAKLADESLSEREYSLYQLLFKASHPAPAERVSSALKAGE